jgi:hypothetical protein
MLSLQTPIQQSINPGIGTSPFKHIFKTKLNVLEGFTFKNIQISGCRVGFSLTTGGLTEATQTAGSIVLLDSKISATLAAVQVL